MSNSVCVFPITKENKGIPHGQFLRPAHIPGSKSHSIRALLCAALCKGNSVIYNLLDSEDVSNCKTFLSTLGVKIETQQERALHTPARATTGSAQHVAQSVTYVCSEGLSCFKNAKVDRPIYLGNSGTTLYFATGLAALNKHGLQFDGDASLRSRSATPLLNALAQLGATVTDTNHGCVPYRVKHSLHAGHVAINCPTSQYLSSLLLVLSLISGTSTLDVTLAGEHPYVDMTISWLQRYGATVTFDNDYTKFTIKGGLTLVPSSSTIPGDFSSAAFFLGVAAITGRTLCLHGLQPDATQADMHVLEILKKMGCTYTWENVHNDDTVYVLKISGPRVLLGGKFDLSAIPDSLPILAVVAAYADGPTHLYNVQHARKKETDRISIMAQELTRLHVKVEERYDGLIITPSSSTKKGLASGKVNAHKDHRIAMAFASGATAAQDSIIIRDAEAVNITFPTFFSTLRAIGVKTATVRDV